MICRNCGSEMEREDDYEIDGDHCVPAAIYYCPDCGTSFIWVRRYAPQFKRIGVVVWLHNPQEQDSDPPTIHILSA